MEELPWKKASGIGGSSGPGVLIEFEIAGIKFRVRPTVSTGILVSRMRYRVECVDCDYCLHDDTTDPGSHVRWHANERHGFKGEIANRGSRK